MHVHLLARWLDAIRYSSGIKVARLTSISRVQLGMSVRRYRGLLNLFVGVIEVQMHLSLLCFSSTADSISQIVQDYNEHPPST